MDARFGELGEELRTAVSELRPESVCLVDQAGDVLWLSEGALGPDEHGAVRSAYESFANRDSTGIAREDLGDNRLAVVLRAENDAKVMAGAFLFIVDTRSVSTALQSGGDAQFLTPQVRSLLGRFAHLISPPLTHAATLPEPTLSAADPLDGLELVSLDELQDRASERASPTVAATIAPSAESPARMAPRAAAPVVGDATAARPADSARPMSPPLLVAVPTLAAAPAPATVHSSPPRVPASQASPALDRALAALRRVTIVLHAQRLAPARRGTSIRRYEVLMRSPAATSADSAPHRMLEQAARDGLGSVIDRRVFTDLLGWLVRNPGVWDARPAMFSVNLSATSVQDEQFSSFVAACLAKANLPRGTIAFELPDMVCREQGEHFERLATTLQGLGCPLVIDDFSWHPRSAELLRSRGVRMIKLDPALTNDVEQDNLKRAQVAGIVQMARVLGLHTVVKRVQPGGSQEILVALGVDFFQSFALAPPLDLATLAARLTGASNGETVHVPELPEVQVIPG
jgi:EAL domain-containing protein (putative c-di-GMP-specific phosphodiesterase class I)